MVREIEAMAVSARSHQSDMHDHFLPHWHASVRARITGMMLLMIKFTRLQVRRIKVLLSRCVCTELDIVD